MKSVEEIYQELTARFETLTGAAAVENSDLAARFYAVAAEIYSLYVQADWTRRQCFPQTAVGENLERHAALRGLKRRPAAPAEGIIRFYLDAARNDDVEVAESTVCMTAGELRFLTTEAGVIRAGELYADVPARAAVDGTAGNVAAGTILSMVVAPTAVSACINPQPFSGGRDEESDDSLRGRVMETYARLANGANAAYYRQAALAFDQVTAAQVLPRSRGIGTVDVVIATQTGAPEQELLDEVKDHIQAMREIAVDVEVLAPEVVPVDVELSVTAGEDADPDETATRVEDAVRGWFTGERLGKDVLLARLNALAFGQEGVENCTVLKPGADVTIGATQLPVLGTLTVRMA